MSRALTAALALTLLASVSLVPELAPVGGGGRAAAADCAWQRHSKRVVKRVKRNGRVRRVVRTKHWWSCVPLPAPAASVVPPAALPAPAPPPTPTPETEALPRRVSARVSDSEPEAFTFTLSRLYVVAGEVTVELNNKEGQDPHNLNLRPEGSADPPLEVGEAGKGESRVARFNLSPGNYRLWCSLPQHEEWGMKVNLEVRAG